MVALFVYLCLIASAPVFSVPSKSEKAALAYLEEFRRGNGNKRMLQERLLNALDENENIIELYVPLFWILLGERQHNSIEEHSVAVQQVMKKKARKFEKISNLPVEKYEAFRLLQARINVFLALGQIKTNPSLAKQLVEPLESLEFPDPFSIHMMRAFQNADYYQQVVDLVTANTAIIGQHNVPVLMLLDNIDDPFGENVPLPLSFFLGPRLAPAEMTQIEQIDDDENYDSDWDWLDHAVYINLDRRLDRRFMIESTLIDIPQRKLERLSAVSDKDRPKVACAKSHISVLKMAKKNNWEHVLILEDDSVFWREPALVSQHLDHVLGALEDNWDVIQLAGYVMACGADKRTPNIKRVHMATMSSAYLVNRRYYEPLIDIFTNAARLGLQTDQYWLRYQMSSDWFILDPPAMGQASGASDLTGEEVNWDVKSVTEASISEGPLYCYH